MSDRRGEVDAYQLYRARAADRCAPGSEHDDMLLDWKMDLVMSDSGTAVVVSCYASSAGLGGGMEQTQTLARPSQHRFHRV